jgi:hypothetical protein
MSDRITLTAPLYTKRLAAAVARRRPMLNDTIRVSDHLPMSTLMTGLPATALPRRAFL